jgi:hypothetical protein
MAGLVLDILPPPSIRMTASGLTDEAGAAAYLGHAMLRPLSPRTLRDWRRRGIGPVFRKAPCGRFIWYSVRDLDGWLEACATDPLEAGPGW